MVQASSPLGITVIMVPFLLTVIVVILLAQFFPGVLNVLAWIFFSCIAFIIIGILISN